MDTWKVEQWKSKWKAGPSQATAITVPGESTSTPPALPPNHRAHRVIFIDLARALAVVFMLYGHTVNALLAPEFQRGTWFSIWTFQRGLTSSLFLLLSGFAFSIATSRHWASHLRISPALWRRARRFGLFIMLGYALHFPVARFADLATAGEERWRSFFVVDVLQLIGVTFLGVQFLVLVSRSRRAFTLAAFASALLIVWATPAIWGSEASRVLPAWLAAYVTPASGSLFPLFPWSAFILIGAALGQLYARWGATHLASFASGVLLAPGLLLIAGTFIARALPFALFGTGPWSVVPSEVAVRWGACLVVLSGIAYASRRINRLPHVFGAVAQETLLIYFVHLCIVYGSVWNKGLAQFHGPTLTPAQTVPWVLLLLLSMVALASYWNWCKHARPRTARWITVGTAAALAYRLL